jgi:hypothetical protein
MTSSQGENEYTHFPFPGLSLSFETTVLQNVSNRVPPAPPLVLWILLRDTNVPPVRHTWGCSDCPPHLTAHNVTRMKSPHLCNALVKLLRPMEGLVVGTVERQEVLVRNHDQAPMLIFTNGDDHSCTALVP